MAGQDRFANSGLTKMHRGLYKGHYTGLSTQIMGATFPTYLRLWLGAQENNEKIRR